MSCEDVYSGGECLIDRYGFGPVSEGIVDREKSDFVSYDEK